MTIRTSRAAGVLARLLADAPPAVAQTDGELVREFVACNSPVAFAGLVERHGPMVLGVCLRVLRHRQDAEDAFQATFLVLARKAGSVLPGDAVGNWLHGVALKTAVRARAIGMKRRSRETLVPSVPEAAQRESGWDDVAEVLDAELRSLPNHYRTVLLLCDVEGRTRADAAHQLGCPEGSVSSRLSRARAMLAKRLTKRGVTLPAGAVALLVGQHAAGAVPAALVTSTVAAVGSLAAGSVLGSGVSPAVTTLTEGMLKAMFITKLKTATVAAVLIGLLGLGGVAGLGRADGQDPPEKAKAEAPKQPGGAEEPALRRPADPRGKEVRQVEKEPLVWGEASNGVRIGIALLPQGRVSVALENVGKEDLMVNLGMMLANGKKQLPAGIHLTAIDGAKKTHTLTFNEPRVAGRVDPFIVPLPSGGRYSVPVALDDFSCADLKGPLQAGDYKLVAGFAGDYPLGKTNVGMEGLASFTYWAGSAKSGETELTVPAKPK